MQPFLYQVFLPSASLELEALLPETINPALILTLDYEGEGLGLVVRARG